MRISDWSSDVCSSDLAPTPAPQEPPVVFDEPSPMDTPSPPVQRQSAPPPAPPAPAAPADSSPMIAPPQATKSTTAPTTRKAAEPTREDRTSTRLNSRH